MVSLAAPANLMAAVDQTSFYLWLVKDEPHPTTLLLRPDETHHRPGLYQALFGSISRKLIEPEDDPVPSISSSQASSSLSVLA